MKSLSRTTNFLAVIGVLLTAALVRPYLQRRIRHRPWFTYSCLPLDQSAYATLAARPRWSRDSVRVADDTVLYGLTRRPQRQGAPWLLFFPGNDAHQLEQGQNFLERVCGGTDWGCAVYAYRGYDLSQGLPGPESLASDGIWILDNLMQNEHLNASQLHVAGFSLGTYVAMYVAGQAALSNRRLASLTLMASISEIEMVHSPLTARIMLGDIYQTLPFLKAIPFPVLILHGDSDQVVDISQGRSNAAHLGNRAKFVVIPGAEHALNENESAIAEVREMVESKSMAISD